MIRKTIDESLGRIELDRSRQAAVWSRIQEIEASGETGYASAGRSFEGPAVRTFGRPLRVMVVVFLLIVALSVLCIAAELPSKIMSLMEPVNEAVVYNGIEMKVVSAVADDDSVMILYTMRDLEGSRISDNTSIYDFSLSRATTLGTYPVGYDPETRTATFCMAGDNGSEMKGRKLTLSITSFLDGATMELHETKRSLQELLEQRAAYGEPEFRDYNADEEDSYWNAQSLEGAARQEEFDNKDNVPILTEGAANIIIPGVDWVTVTNIGYKDGWLHVQLKYDGEKSEINHGCLCLTDAKGNELDIAVLNSPLPGNLEEYMMEVGSDEDFSSIYLSGMYTNYDSLITGEWETTFKVKGVETKTVACEIETDSIMIDRIVLSPLGVTVYGNGIPDDSIQDSGIEIYMKDGTEIASEGSSGSGDEVTGKYECKFKFSAPVDIEAVEKISIAGKTITVPY